MGTKANRFLVLLLVTGCNCGTISPRDGGVGDGGSPSPDGGEIPIDHRPAGQSCPTTRGPGNPDPGIFGCTNDAQCDAGTNGRCNPALGGALMNVCTYDQCFQDSDCGTGVPCDCRSDFNANVCRSGSNCRVDGDCGANGYCSPSKPSSFSCTTTYYCHTSQDRCINDSDCGDAGSGICAYDQAHSRWDCAFFCAIP
jgi:hypothetical protein